MERQAPFMQDRLEALLDDIARDWNSIFFCGCDTQTFANWVARIVGREQPAHNIALLPPDCQVEFPEHTRAVLASSEELSGKDFLRSAARQDPDCVIVDQRVVDATEMLLTMRQTGHRTMVAWPALAEPSWEALILSLIAANGADLQFWAQFWRRDYFFEFDSSGQLQRVFQLQELRLVERLSWQGQTWVAGAAVEETPKYRAPEPEPIPWSAEWAAPERSLLELLRQNLGPHRKACWVPQVGGEPGPLHSRLGGPALLASGEEWPCCGDCGQPMLPVISVHPDDIPEPAYRDLGWFQFFYCVDRNCHCPNAWEVGARNRLARFVSEPLEASPLGALSDYPAVELSGWQQRHDASDDDLWPEFRQWSGSWQDDLANSEFERWYPGYRENFQLRAEQLPEVASYLDTYRGDKWGGWPAWAQGIEYPDCPHCSQRMSLLYQLNVDGGEGSHFPQLFAADGTGHIYICPDHKELLFSWACG